MHNKTLKKIGGLTAAFTSVMATGALLFALSKDRDPQDKAEDFFAGKDTITVDIGGNEYTIEVEKKDFISLNNSLDPRSDYLYRQYGMVIWRYWDQIDQVLKDQFAYSEIAPIMWHEQFLLKAETALKKIDDPAEQKAEFDRLAARYFSEEANTAQHYFPAIQSFLLEQAEKIAAEKTMIENTLQSLSQQYPGLTITPTPELSTRIEIDHFAKSFFPEERTGTGLHWGEYGVAHSLEGDQIVATDFLMDCIAVVLTSQNPENPNDRYAVVAHLDATTNAENAISKLLAEIPQNHVIEAQILGSSRNESVYLNVDVINALANSERIKSLGVNTDGPTTVAVHAQSGTILSVNDPDKSERNSYEILPETLPVYVTFEDTEPLHSYRSQSYSQLRYLTPNTKFVPSSVIVRKAHPNLPNEQHRSAETTLERLIAIDGKIDPEDLRALAKDIEENMHAPNGACIYTEAWPSGKTLVLNANIYTETDIQIDYLNKEQINFDMSQTYGEACEVITP